VTADRDIRRIIGLVWALSISHPGVGLRARSTGRSASTRASTNTATKTATETATRTAAAAAARTAAATTRAALGTRTVGVLWRVSREMLRHRFVESSCIVLYPRKNIWAEVSKGTAHLWGNSRSYFAIEFCKAAAFVNKPLETWVIQTSVSARSCGRDNFEEWEFENWGNQRVTYLWKTDRVICINECTAQRCGGESCLISLDLDFLDILTILNGLNMLRNRRVRSDS
jgi:hypothetical protein